MFQEQKQGFYMFFQRSGNQIIKREAIKTGQTPVALLAQGFAAAVAEGLGHLITIGAAKFRWIGQKQEAIAALSQRDLARPGNSSHYKPPLLSQASCLPARE